MVLESVPPICKQSQKRSILNRIKTLLQAWKAATTFLLNILQTRDNILRLK